MSIALIIGLIFIVLVAGITATICTPVKYKPFVAFIFICANAFLSVMPAITALTTHELVGSFMMPHLQTSVDIRLDSLSAWFILIINFTCINGLLFGTGYLKAYQEQKTNIEIHWPFYILLHSSLLLVCMFDSGIAFLFVWEMMSLATLMLLLFDYQNKETIKAGISFLVQMHICVILLIVGFIALYTKTGLCNFTSLALLTKSSGSVWIFTLLIAGFAIKAGFIPFHTWLPLAHPAAPSHVSGVMSGVIVKMGIFGILRVVSQLQFDQMIFGQCIVAISTITAVYGIVNAAVQNDIKRLLAYCTIENIGIIGIGIGLGLIGVAGNNSLLILLGFTGALLHTLNHALFKSLLFFGAGSVYQRTHTRNMDNLGGLIKKMPITSIFFLIGALAIGGLPPFNGFISEFILYSGLFNGLNDISNISMVIMLLLTIIGLALVGGVSVLTFTKSFGITFLGNPRTHLHTEPTETPFIMHLPQYLIVAAMLSIAVVPQFYLHISNTIVTSLFVRDGAITPTNTALIESITLISHVGLLFIGLVALLWGLRWLILRNRESLFTETWGCAYTTPITKAQYTGSSFIRPLSQLLSFAVKEEKHFEKIEKGNIFPVNRSFSSFYADIIDKHIISPITRHLMFLLNYFSFIQNGQLQLYIIYGIFFIGLIFLLSIFKLII